MSKKTFFLFLSITLTIIYNSNQKDTEIETYTLSESNFKKIHLRIITLRKTSPKMKKRQRKVKTLKKNPKKALKKIQTHF